jgi:hypothetical protein
MTEKEMIFHNSGMNSSFCKIIGGIYWIFRRSIYNSRVWQLCEIALNINPEDDIKMNHLSG